MTDPTLHDHLATLADQRLGPEPSVPPIEGVWTGSDDPSGRPPG